MNNPLFISTTLAPAKADHVVISYNWRSTDKRVVPETQKHRSIAVPTATLVSPEVLSVPLKFRPMILAALEEIAASRLADFCMDSSMAATTISADLFTTDALLSWNADRIALQQRLTTEEIKAWAPTSATVAFVKSLHGEPGAKAITETLIKLASPNHGLTKEMASKLLASLWQNSDSDSMTGLRVMLKLKSIAEAESAASLLGSILG